MATFYEGNHGMKETECLQTLNYPICKWLQIVIRKAFNPFQLVMLGIIEKSQLVSYCINLLVLSINHNKIVAVKAMIKKYILSLILLYQIQN